MRWCYVLLFLLVYLQNILILTITNIVITPLIMLYIECFIKHNYNTIIPTNIMMEIL